MLGLRPQRTRTPDRQPSCWTPVTGMNRRAVPSGLLGGR